MNRPRKVLSVSHSYVVGMNRRLANEMSRVSQGRWEVVAVAPRFFHGDLQPLSLQIGPEDVCEVRGVRTVMSRSNHGFFYGLELRDLLHGGQDLVHAWEEPFVLSGAQIAWWTPPKIPLVFATAQNLSKRYPPPFAQLERFAIQRASGWIAFGQTVSATLNVREDYRAKPSEVIPMGVDVDDFKPDPAARKAFLQKLGWEDPGPPIVGYLGRFVPEKGLPLLLEALDAQTTPFRALFIGGGPMRPALEQWAAKRPGLARVITGVSHAQVPSALNAMDVLCAPSQTIPHWKEQFGRMIAEAFACGVPVLASSSGEIPFTVSDAGTLLPEKDAKAWSQAIAELLGQPERRTELGHRGRERALAHFAWPVVARRHIAFFERVMNEAPP